MAYNKHIIDRRTSLLNIGISLVVLLTFIFLTPKAHTRIMPDAHPQSPVQLAQALSTAIDSGHLDDVMRLFNWRNVAAAEAMQVKALWLQTFKHEELINVEVIPFYRDFETENHSAGYYSYIINDAAFYSNLFIEGEVRLTFKRKLIGGGFLSASTVSLPYGEVNPDSRLHDQPSWLFANNINIQLAQQ